MFHKQKSVNLMSSRGEITEKSVSVDDDAIS